MNWKWSEQLNKEQDQFNEVLSFDEYMEFYLTRPHLECRPNCHYLKDMFDYFGRDQDGNFKVFLKDHPNSPPVFGQSKVQALIYHNLINFTEEGFNNKFILLIGPNGSSKSSIIRKVMEGTEDYSKTKDGTLYTFSWVFPIESYVKGTLGLNPSSLNSSAGPNSYAHLEDKDISSILVSELRDHPLLLLPLATRRTLIEDTLAKHPKLLESVKKSYLYNGDVSKRNRMIFDSLLKSYQGQYEKVLKHIRIEKFVISKRHSTGAVTIEPQLHVDARVQQITMDRRLASLPPTLQSLNLFNMEGEIVLANRGILEFSDLLKRPLDAYKYLLMTMETQNINLHGILTELDIFFIGSSNEIHLSAFKQHPDFNSFKGRINFLRVPYLLNAFDEEKIYKKQINNLKNKTTFEPHALETLCLWSVMTRLRPSQKKNFENKKLGDLAASLAPLEKTLLLSNQTIPERFNSEEKQILKLNINEISKEYENDNLYEGKFGISPREVKQIIYEVSTLQKNITFIEMQEFLTKFVERKNEYDFLNIAQQGDYNNPLRFLNELNEHNLNQFDQELRESLGLIDDRSYEDYIARYILQINSLLKKEKVKNPITGRFEECDMFFIREFENNIKLNESADLFRSHMISTLGAYSLDNPGKKIIYTEVFPDTVRLLKESFREEQKKLILNLAKNLVFYGSEANPGAPQETNSSLNQEGKDLTTSILRNLQVKFQYSHDGALTLLKYLIKERY